MKRPTLPLPFLFAAGIGLAATVVASPAVGSEPERQKTSQDATASSDARAGSAASGSQRVTVITRSGRGDRSAHEDCQVVNRGSSGSGDSEAGQASGKARGATSDELSSTVRIPGSGGLSGTTRAPGGSSVTVQSDGGSSSSSAAAASTSSGDSRHSSVVAGTGQGEECVITINPGASNAPSDQQQKR